MESAFRVAVQEEGHGINAVQEEGHGINARVDNMHIIVYKKIGLGTRLSLYL